MKYADENNFLPRMHILNTNKNKDLICGNKKNLLSVDFIKNNILIDNGIINFDKKYLLKKDNNISLEFSKSLSLNTYNINDFFIKNIDNESSNENIMLNKTDIKNYKNEIDFQFDYLLNNINMKNKNFYKFLECENINFEYLKILEKKYDNKDKINYSYCKFILSSYNFDIFGNNLKKFKEFDLFVLNSFSVTIVNIQNSIKKKFEEEVLKISSPESIYEFINDVNNSFTNNKKNKIERNYQHVFEIINNKYKATKFNDLQVNKNEININFIRCRIKIFHNKYLKLENVNKNFEIEKIKINKFENESIDINKYHENIFEILNKFPKKIVFDNLVIESLNQNSFIKISKFKLFSNQKLLMNKLESLYIDKFIQKMFYAGLDIVSEINNFNYNENSIKQFKHENLSINEFEIMNVIKKDTDESFLGFSKDDNFDIPNSDIINIKNKTKIKNPQILKNKNEFKNTIQNVANIEFKNFSIHKISQNIMIDNKKIELSISKTRDINKIELKNNSKKKIKPESVKKFEYNLINLIKQNVFKIV